MSKQHQITVTGHTIDGRKLVGPSINDFSAFTSKLFFDYLELRQYWCEGTVKEVSPGLFNRAVEKIEKDVKELKSERSKLLAERAALRASGGTKDIRGNDAEPPRFFMPCPAGASDGDQNDGVPSGMIELVDLAEIRRRRLFGSPLEEAEWWVKVNAKNLRYLTKLIIFFGLCIDSDVVKITLP